MNTTGTIDLESLTGRPRIIRTKSLIQKVKQRLSRKKRVSSSRILAKEMNVSRTTMRRIIKDLGLKVYVKQTTPHLKQQRKMKRKSFRIWVRKNTGKSMVEKILFSDE